MHGCWMECARRAARNHRSGLIATAQTSARAAVLLAGLLPLAPALAQEAALPAAEAPAAPTEPTGPVFSQRGVPAEATAADAVQAKERAFAAGRRTAWEALAASAGVPAPNLSDARIESLVSSIIVEQERVTPTRYSARLTVNFSPDRSRAALGQATAGTPAPVAAPAATPASVWLDATATYRSMGEWLELRRRLQGSGPVAAVEVKAIAVDAARLRLGLRLPPAEAAGSLAAQGVALQPVSGATPGDAWRVGLAGG